MELMTISEVTKALNITPRTLRYYDEIGLLPSMRKENYAYRVYDEAAVKRLQQIIVLRKLRIPLKKIALIFQRPEQTQMIEVFQQNLLALDNEIAALQKIRDLLRLFIAEMNTAAGTGIPPELPEDGEILRIARTLSLSEINLKENSLMNQLDKADEALSALKDVRILHIPPCTVAASHFIGQSPEHYAEIPLIDFIRKSNLYEIKPDARVFGFNHPNPSRGKAEYGYEFWVTVPDDMEVPEPLQKKQFTGGLYAAHCIKMGNFHEWAWLSDWVKKSTDYEPDPSEKGREIMDGCLEEHLNYVYYAVNRPEKGPGEDSQVDLLEPVRPK